MRAPRPLSPTAPTILSRRAVLGGLAGSAAALLTGCGGSGEQQAAGQAQGTPTRGGRLRAAFAGGSTETLDPHKGNLYIDVARIKAMFERLADIGGDMSVTPRLAESWEGSDDLTRWRIRLREATFHDGKPLTAQDVLYSYARITDPDEAYRAKADLASLDLRNSRALGDRELEIALKWPVSEFDFVLAAFGAYIVQDGATDFATKPVGTGPFAHTSFTPERSWVGTRNPDYWDGAPYLDELEVLVADEETARVNALLGDQVEYAHDLSPTTARTHEASGQATIVRLPRSSTLMLAMKVDRPPFDDPDVRRAFFALANREELVETVLPGAGEVANDVFGKGDRFYAELPQRTQDLDRARSLLRRAGAEGLRVTLDTAPVGTGFVETASIFAEQARQAGVQVEVATGNKDSYWTDTRDNGMLAVYRSGAMPIRQHIAQRLLSSSPTNVTKWARPEFDALYQQAQTTADVEQRRELYRRMQAMLHEEGGYLIWGFADAFVGTAGTVGGVEPAPQNTLDWARFDKVWMA